MQDYPLPLDRWQRVLDCLPGFQLRCPQSKLWCVSFLPFSLQRNKPRVFVAGQCTSCPPTFASCTNPTNPTSWFAILSASSNSLTHAPPFCSISGYALEGQLCVPVCTGATFLKMSSACFLFRPSVRDSANSPARASEYLCPVYRRKSNVLHPLGRNQLCCRLLSRRRNLLGHRQGLSAELLPRYRRYAQTTLVVGIWEPTHSFTS